MDDMMGMGGELLIWSVAGILLIDRSACDCDH
jgi:hypothetical protein